jgi:ATP-dependent DNA helicase RecQ
VDSALKILNRAGYIEYTEEQDNQARVMFTIGRNDLYRLENNSPDEEKVITALLRNYGGLFVDYNYIDESFIASQCGLKPQQVYLILKGLSEKHILHFIPQKKTPYVRYLQRREDIEYVRIPPAVYEDRKEQYRQRIHAMIEYATTDNICRSRQLLRYFGETESHDCHQCDVCLSDTNDNVEEPATSPEAHAILELLSDGKEHHITELSDIQLPTEQLNVALEYLLSEEYIHQNDGFIYSAKGRKA